MVRHPEAELVSFLEERSEQVKDLEALAEKTLYADKDEAAYRDIMLQKAKLLLALADDAEPILANLTGEIRERATPTIKGFSQSAAMSMRIGSVFFMSALLYPDEHKKGEPNNLELFITSLKNQA